MRASGDNVVERVRNALRSVIDPELGYSVVDLGFIYHLTVDRGIARIVMTTTTRGCPAAGLLKDGVAASAATVAGIEAAEVALTYEPPWSPSMMSADAKAMLGFAEVH